MVGIFKGRNGTRKTAVLVIDAVSYVHLGRKTIISYTHLQEWAKARKQITYKELLEW